MNTRHSSEFAADPITTKPASKAGLPEPVSPPLHGDNNGSGNLTGSGANSLLNPQGNP